MSIRKFNKKKSSMQLVEMKFKRINQLREPDVISSTYSMSHVKRISSSMYRWVTAARVATYPGGVEVAAAARTNCSSLRQERW